MAIQQHTPGPWSLRSSNNGSADIGITAPGLKNILAECFAAMRSADERAIAECEANARLIAAAPVLLAAAITVEDQLCDLGTDIDPDYLAGVLRAAIQEAKGE